MKNNNYLKWQDYFMAMAILASKRSKDPNTQVGCCIVNKDNRVIGVGYNGMPNGCNDDDFPWGREGDFLNTKYAWVCHSEVNAILNSSSNVKGATLYVTLFPCNECAKVIIQSGISMVQFLNDKYYDSDASIAARLMFDKASVKYQKYVPTIKSIYLDLVDPQDKND